MNWILETIEYEEDFAYKYNRNEIYNFTSMTDDLLIEFFPIIPYMDFLAHGKINEDIIECFKEHFNFEIGYENAIKLVRLRKILEEVFEGYGIMGVYKKGSITLNVNTENLLIKFTISKKEFYISAKSSVKIFKYNEVTRENIIISINQLLLDKV